MVSILARSGDRALQDGSNRTDHVVEVSILARSGDRALQSDIHLSWAYYQFQSSPGLVTGRYINRTDRAWHQESFNPRPVW